MPDWSSDGNGSWTYGSELFCAPRTIVDDAVRTCDDLASNIADMLAKYYYSKQRQIDLTVLGPFTGMFFNFMVFSPGKFKYSGSLAASETIECQLNMKYRLSLKLYLIE